MGNGDFGTPELRQGWLALNSGLTTRKKASRASTIVRVFWLRISILRVLTATCFLHPIGEFLLLSGNISQVLLPTRSLFAAMPCTSARQPLQRLLSESSSVRQIASFLAPSITCKPNQKGFSTTQKSLSRIGGAAISVPPEVSLRFYDLPKSNVRSRKADVPTSAIEVVGPLGKS